VSGRLFRLDSRALARAFDRASASYDAAAQLQAATRDELLERLQYFRVEPGVILDLGAGTGAGSETLRRRFPHARVIAVDVAPAMLRAAGKRQRWWRRFERICADALALPLATGCIDLVFSNLMLQWCDRPGAVFAEIRRVLSPKGLLLFSSFGPETLQELRLAWSRADPHPHVSQFPDMPELSALMQQAGLSEPVLDIDRRVVHYTDARALMRELQAIGARNAIADRHRGLTGRGRLQRMHEAYEISRRPQGLPATFELIYGAAFGGLAITAGGAAEVHVSPDQIGIRRHHS
jgi:malonyl-CoA O-methyltransferase